MRLLTTLLLVLGVSIREVSIHNTILPGGTAARGCAGTGGALSARLTLVHGLAHGHHLLLQCLHLLLHVRNIISGDGILQLLKLGIYRLLHVVRQLLAQILHLLLRLVHHAVRLVLGIDGITLALVLRSELLSLIHHALYLIAGECGGTGDGDVLRLAAPLVGGSHAQDAVGINIELNLNLRHTTGRGGDAIQAEVAQALVVLDKLALTLQHVDLHRRLPIRGSGEHLTFGGGQRGVACDELGHDTTERLKANAQGGHIQKHNVTDFAREHTSLHRCTQGHHLIRVDSRVRRLAGHALDHIHNCRDPGGASHEDDLVKVLQGQVSVLQRILDWDLAAVQKIGAHLLKLRASNCGLNVLGSSVGGGDKGEGQAGLRGRRQLHLGLLGRLCQTLQRLAIFQQVNALVLLELVREEINNALVEVIAAQVGVAAGGQDLKHAVSHLQDGHIKCAATQVKDQNGLIGLLLKAVGKRRGGGLVDDAQHLEASNLAGILGGLALAVVEVGRHRDDGLLDLVIEELAGIVHQLAQYASADFLGGKLLAGVGALDLHIAVGILLHNVRNLRRLLLHLVHAAAHKALHGEESVGCVHHCLALGNLADQALASLAVGDNGGSCACALSVCDNSGLAALHGSHSGVGGAQVDAHNLLAANVHRGRAARRARGGSDGGAQRGDAASEEGAARILQTLPGAQIGGRRGDRRPSAGEGDGDSHGVWTSM
mmetsp:Transcript_860/g.2099  ORF Transcript_860/g.2099 Transcript_860/m.2099 type:complete len:714 (-) Transcript_860:79-2220(-)